MGSFGSKIALQSVLKRSPATVNNALAAVNDFYIRRGLGPAAAARVDAPVAAPRALDKRAQLRYLRAVQTCPSPRRPGARAGPVLRRHTFATTLVRGGTDLVIVAEFLGHARLETTRGYTRPSAEDRTRALRPASRRQIAPLRGPDGLFRLMLAVTRPGGWPRAR